ncbi:unnamed protein product [Leptidea sinapis]|uniref:B box-type domain-containing protein n=1 Tax=Leptidea sinapis TaxID=189913 RepID=A0A5E4QI71_9NEOP|nr:unnamed protein product [Leptidea sinapis]
METSEGRGRVGGSDLPIINCAICNTRIPTHNSSFVDNLPSNLYIDTLLSMVGIKPDKQTSTTPPSTPATPGLQSVDLFAAGVRCMQCKSMCDSSDVSYCEHCKLNFCRVCWSQHIEDLRIQVGSILKQLDVAASRLDHKIEHYKDRCERIVEQISLAADEKINTILEGKAALLKEISELQKCEDMTALALQSTLNEAREVANVALKDEHNFKHDSEKVSVFINLHQNTLQLLTDISKWDADSFVFDKENFRIDTDMTTACDAESRNFVPHYMWRKTSRPCGVGIGPWNNHLYICDTDSHSVIVVERTQAKIVKRLSCQEMLCPVQIAFMKSLGEIYITGQKGSRVGMFRSPEGIATDNVLHHIYVVDTGNDRVQIIQPDGKFVDQLGVSTKHQPNNTSSIWETKEVLCTELNAPSSVAVTSDRVVILDSGNRRVKVYNKQDRSKIMEFGSTGHRKGQFNKPEVLAVDPMGYIFVGDSGNCRVQIFKPNGQLVRVFGRIGHEPGKFGWISGIHVTKQLDVIISDTKNHCVNFF